MCASLVFIDCRSGDAGGISHASSCVRGSREQLGDAVMFQVLRTHEWDGSFLTVHVFLLQGGHTAYQFQCPAERRATHHSAPVGVRFARIRADSVLSFLYCCSSIQPRHALAARCNHSEDLELSVAQLCPGVSTSTT